MSSNRICQLSWAVLLSMLICVGVARAQDKDKLSLNSTLDLTEISIDSLLDTKVTTASKRSETMFESPAAVFVVDSTDISRYGYQTLAEALRSVVGLYTSSDRSFDYLGVRGYSRFGDYNGRILLLVDGHRVNDPIFDTATIGDDCPIDMQSIERIEVVKGPGSSLWGTNALLATVNIITRKGKDLVGGRFSANNDKTFIEYGNTYGDGLDVSCSLSGLRSNGESSIYFPEFDSPETNNGIAQNVDANYATRGYVTASYKGFGLFFNRGKRAKTIPTASYGTIFNDPGNILYDDRTHLELSLEHPETKSSRCGVLTRIYTDQYRYIGDYAYDYPPRVVNRDHDISRLWGGEIKLSDAISDTLSVVYGVEYQRVYHMTQSNYDVDPHYEYYTIATTQTTRSLYAQANYRPSSSLHFTLGTRYDDYSTFGGTWSPRAAMVYSPSSNTSIKLLYGSAFRAPNAYELSWADPSMPTTQPEKIETQELVFERRFGVNSRLITSVFRFDVEDIISLIETEDSWYIANQGSAKSTGVEMQYETKSNYGTRGYAGISLTKFTASEGQETNAPNCLITCGMSVPIFSHKYYLSPQVRTTGKLLTKAGEKIDPAVVVDCVLASAARVKGTEISLGVYNLFDSAVYAPAPTELTQDTVPQARRTLRLTVSRRF